MATEDGVIAVRTLQRGGFPTRVPEKFAAVKFDEDILPELQELDLLHREIVDAVGLSRSYVSDVLRGEKTPSLENWDRFVEVSEAAGN